MALEKTVTPLRDKSNNAYPPVMTNWILVASVLVPAVTELIMELVTTENANDTPASSKTE